MISHTDMRKKQNKTSTSIESILDMPENAMGNQTVLWIEICLPKIHRLSPTYNETVFEDGAFKNVIKVK